MMKIKKRHIFAIFLLAFVGLNIISMSSVFLLTFKVQPSFAVDYEEEDIQQFADSDLRNVTVILDTTGVYYRMAEIVKYLFNIDYFELNNT